MKRTSHIRVNVVHGLCLFLQVSQRQSTMDMGTYHSPERVYTLPGGGFYFRSLKGVCLAVRTQNCHCYRHLAWSNQANAP